MNHALGKRHVCALVLLLIGCSGGDGSERSATSAPSAAGAPTANAEAAKRPAAEALNACSLLTKAEVEQTTGRSTLEPSEERVAGLSICTFGDPEAPVVNGRPMSSVVKLDVFTGSETGYYAGAVAQAKDLFAMARKNAGEVESITGMGDEAYWNEPWNTISVLRGKYKIDVTVSGGADPARKLAARVLERLP